MLFLLALSLGFHGDTADINLDLQRMGPAGVYPSPLFPSHHIDHFSLDGQRATKNWICLLTCLHPLATTFSQQDTRDASSPAYASLAACLPCQGCLCPAPLRAAQSHTLLHRQRPIAPELVRPPARWSCTCSGPASVPEAWNGCIKLTEKIFPSLHQAEDGNTGNTLLSPLMGFKIKTTSKVAFT